MINKEELLKKVKSAGGIRKYLLSLGKFKDVAVEQEAQTK